MFPGFERTHAKIFFSAAAPFYDFFVGKGMTKNARKGIEMLPSVKGHSALDVCTGTGIMAKTLWEEGAKVTAVDFSSFMLKRAAKKLNNTGIKLELMDAGSLKFPADSFDLVTISMGLHEIPGSWRIKVLQEIKRVCREYILIIDHHNTPENKVYGIMTMLFEKLEGSSYQEFIKEDPEEMLKEAEINVIQKEIERNTCFLLCSPNRKRHD